MDLDRFLARLQSPIPDPERYFGELMSGLEAPDSVADLTCALARSGDVLDWSGNQRFAGRVSVDLPSTGGASNKTPLVAPLLAIAAAPERLFVPKVSSRGRVAGTIDILESVGYRADVSLEEYATILADARLSNIVQTDRMVPADRSLMKLRRQTGWMDVPELVVSSILSKKLASGCRNIVVDLKAGDDSKFGDLDGCIRGAKLFVDVGRVLRDRGLVDGVWVAVTNSYRPQGRAFGRIASLWEASDVLAGERKGFVARLCRELAARMLMAAGIERDLGRARAKIDEPATGKVLETAGRWLSLHGVDPKFLADPKILLRGLQHTEIPPSTTGLLLAMNTQAISDVLHAVCQGSDDIYSPGLILSADPEAGSQMEQESLGTLLSRMGTTIEPQWTRTISSSTFSYPVSGAQARIAPLPEILYDLGFVGDTPIELASWERLSDGAIALITDGKTPCRYLLVHNRKWKVWNFLSGHAEVTDSNQSATIGREIVEELGDELPRGRRFAPGIHFNVYPRGVFSEIWKSGSAGVWTRYRLAYFDVRFKQPDLIAELVRDNPDYLCWATEQDLQRGLTSTGQPVAPFPAVRMAIQGRLGRG